MPPIGPIGDGGGGIGAPFLDVSPSEALAFGDVAALSTKDIVLAVQNTGSQFTHVNTITVGGAPYSIIGAPTLPLRLNPGDSFTFTVRFSPTIAGTYNDTLTITADAGTDNAPYTAALSGTAPGAGAALSVTPGPVVFPDTIFTHSATPIAVVVKNIGNAAVQLNTIALLGGAPFGLTGVAALPLTLNPNDTTTFNVTFSPNSVQTFNDTVRIGTATIGNVDTPVQGAGVALIPVAIIGANVRQIVMSFQTPNGTVSHKSLDPTSLNNVDLSGALVFNGTLWNDPGNERTLMRVEIFYENYGVAGLNVLVTAFRPLPTNADNIQQITKVISIGTVGADLTERSVFADIQMSGELITINITRNVNGGPVSLIGILPHWEPKGEKIAGT